LTAVTEDASISPKKPKTSVAFACVLLSLSLLLAFPIIGSFAYNSHGLNGIIAAGLAGAICWSGAMIALVLVGVFRNSPNQMVSATLLGMLFRMGLPLGAGLFLTNAGGPLAEAGLVRMILVFYLIGLVVETILSVRIMGSSKDVAKAS
jgi:hypothetical protein